LGGHQPGSNALEAPEVLVTVPPPVPDCLILPGVEALIRASGADLGMTADRVAKELADILDGRATPASTRAPCGDRTQRHLETAGS
jgi:hypothetical protein